ncbi:MarR family transcriptional regulator [Natronorubrum daqingense]|uniref:MarR family protein n=1 Tax=Natronorubrum daqingense TaxID=588898 RepID=A0A1N7G4T9_9EURY|nr:helix-turn-helix domain-containing protein [Natronorubrum daqingense]APX98728.1 hypothetical protein BB347_18660 [Natronorubrum daqingense]SIS07619.1 MarR family protein [Natronorubrum daqingense]
MTENGAIERGRKYGHVLTAIASAETPPTRSELALETHRSKSQLRRILTKLHEEDCIEPVPDDDDQRRVRYTLAYEVQ